MTPQETREEDERFAHTLVEMRRTIQGLREAQARIKAFNDRLIESNRIVKAEQEARRRARERDPLYRFGRMIARLFGISGDK